MHFQYLREADPEVASMIDDELARQRDSIELIASENFVSPAVLEAVGSPLTNKYAEGLPGKRYYGGCWAVDRVEDLARERAKKLFGAAFANVQPHSGAQANYAVETAFAKPGDTVVGMDLSNGGHLTHGAAANFSGKLFNIVSYGLDPTTERIDYDDVAEKVARERPAIVIAGASAYPRVIDFERFARIAHENGAILMVDMAHIAGLVAAGAHPSPVPFADVVTSTTHKTLRGTRGGIILWNNPDYTKRINSSVFPGTQGGPLEHAIAGKAVAFGEALRPEFKTYIENVCKNAQALGRGMSSGGLRLVTGGTDNHLLLVDLTAAKNVTGRDAEQALESAGITVNKNTIPGETRSPFVTSGIRVGSAAVTTRGFSEAECERVGELIARTVFAVDEGNDARLEEVHAEVREMLAAHPLYPELG
ncbi:MAG: serine hydroxymethyltransferase [Olsenella sp.]|nr:serine hydroxymethyltransferase [Olsenella sp.]